LSVSDSILIVVSPFGIPFAEQKPSVRLKYTTPTGGPLTHPDQL
jgi:hypothetical protein